MKKLFSPIAIYNYNNNKYFIALDGNQVAYFKYENNEISNDYSDEEIDVFEKVYDSIKVDKKEAVELGIRKIGNKLFDFYYDVRRQLYYWYKIVDGKKCELEKNELELLNYKYNNYSLKLYDEEQEIYDWENDQGFFSAGEAAERQKTIQRAIVYKGKIVALIMMAGISMASLADSVLHSDIVSKVRGASLEKSASDGYEGISSEDYSFDLIRNAIVRNENLHDAEKMFFLKFQPYFDENYKYMDLKLLLDRLSDIQVVYEKGHYEGLDIVGEYDIASNTIRLFSTENFESCDKSALAHEFLHVSQRGYSRRLTMEFSNELTTREYLRRLVDEGSLDEVEYKNEYDVPAYGDGYWDCMRVYYLMANMFDSETIRKYQCIPTDTILVDALIDIDAGGKENEVSNYERHEMEARAIELLDSIDEFRSKETKNGIRNVEYSDEKYQKICELLDYYYEIKFDKTIDECFVEDVMSYDFSVGRLEESTSKEKAISEIMLDELEKNVENIDEGYKIPMGEFRYVLPKTYYSDSHKNPIIYFNVCEKLSSSKGKSYFMDVEVTPEICKRYDEAYKKFEQARVQEQTESKNRDADQISGMGSIDLDRDD